MTFVGDKEYLNMKCFELWDNKYLKKEDDFSGHVLYHSLEGEFVNGWRYTIGKVTHRLGLGNAADVSLELKSAMVCETYTYVAYTDNCTDWYTVGVFDGEPDWDTKTFMYADCSPVPEDISMEECMLINDERGTPPDEDGNPGGYVPPADPTDDCNCSVCLACGGCLPIFEDEPIELDEDCGLCICPPPLVVLDPTFEDTKAECVYDILKTTQMMENLLSVFVGSSRYHVTYKVVPELQSNFSTEQSYGRCKNNGDGKMNVTINAYYFDKEAPVSLAKTILHETIHAHIFQEVVAMGGGDNLENSTFENLYAYYNTYGEIDYQHDYISQYYIPDMAKALREYDNNSYDISYYEALSWMGLHHTYGWQIKTEAEKDIIHSKVSILNSRDKNCN